jgi:hypothetical protein
MNVASIFRITALFAAVILLGAPSAAATDHQHDFDFEFGSWHAHLTRLLHPLSGSHKWVDYNGTSVVHKVWNGKANLGELDVRGPAGRIHGLSLRLYSPQTKKWNVYWANANAGEITTPMIGGFSNGQGLFINNDTFNGRPILARFIFSKMTAHSFQIVQSFSPDNGRTWEANWVATFTR